MKIMFVQSSHAGLILDLIKNLVTVSIDFEYVPNAYTEQNVTKKKSDVFFAPWVFRFLDEIITMNVY